LAVLQKLGRTGLVSTHVAVITVALPFVMALSFLPNLKSLAPVMAAGTVLLMIGFGVLGIVVGIEWPNRPEEPPEINYPQVPLAVCAILYSYEGICLILPIESAMKEPKYFKPVFCVSMALVAVILGTVSSLCVLAFGEVTNGSVTAFLLEAYREDSSITWWLMITNTAVSLSVLLTYPLQLFPALELMGPMVSNWIHRLFGKGIKGVEVDDDDLSAFEPLPPLPEHDVASLDSLPEHQYDIEEDQEKDENGEDVSVSGMSSAFSSVTEMLPKMSMPGDSLQLRAILVVLTYLVAVVVPNVQALISLAGALAGSSTALLIPPILELAWIKHLEYDTGIPEGTTDGVDAIFWMIAPSSSPRDKWWREKVKCYFLLVLGFIFFAIGTYASLADIVKIYLEG